MTTAVALAVHIFGAVRRTRSVHSGCVGCGSEPRNDELAGAETVALVERNMCNAVMRGIVVPPGSKSTSRANGLRWNLGYLGSGRQLFALAVRIGKTRTRAETKGNVGQQSTRRTQSRISVSQLQAAYGISLPLMPEAATIAKR